MGLGALEEQISEKLHSNLISALWWQCQDRSRTCLTDALIIHVLSSLYSIALGTFLVKSPEHIEAVRVVRAIRHMRLFTASSGIRKVQSLDGIETTVIS